MHGTWCRARWVTPAAEWPSGTLVQRGKEYFVQLPNGEWEEWVRPRSDSYLMIADVDGVEGRFFGATTADDIVDRLANICSAHGIRNVHGNQRDDYPLMSLFRQRGLRYFPHPYTPSSKPMAVSHVRSWFRDGRIALPGHEKLKRELLEFQEKITSNGALTFGARGDGHDDYACLLITAALHEFCWRASRLALRWARQTKRGTTQRLQRSARRFRQSGPYQHFTARIRALPRRFLPQCLDHYIEMQHPGA